MTDGDLLNWELSNYVANSAMTHLPQLKSVCGNVIKLRLLLLLNCILHSAPYVIVVNFDRKNLVGRRVDYPAEKVSFRHGGESVDDCLLDGWMSVLY